LTNLKEIKIKELAEKYFEINHPTGLKIIICPMKNYTSSHAILGTVYGSVNNCFGTLNGDLNTVPEGIAHFLEHKLFEDKSGRDTFELFSETGADVNAFTSFEKTCYFFSGTSSFLKNLKILLEFVNSPYFTEKTIEKEQDIIAQEIKMYNDDPDWQVFFNTLAAIYIKHPIRTDIAGTIQSISKITKELLYTCYGTYYAPNNMILVATGNVEPESVVTCVNELYNSKEFKQISFENIMPEEPTNINKKIIRKCLPVSIPLITVGFKCKSGNKVENFTNKFKYDMLLKMLFGETSAFFKKCYETGLVTEPFELQALSGNGFVSLLIGAKTITPEKLYEGILNEIGQKHVSGLNSDDFRCHKKDAFSSLVKTWEQPDALANVLFDLATVGLDFNSLFESISKLQINELEKLFKDNVEEEKSVLSVVSSS
jgi:predicted Zn-dependent peptidase